MTTRLDLSVLGTLKITLDGEHVDTFVSRKAEALLVYLACTKRTHAREVVAELLWHERPRKQALANLRVVLSSLRKTVTPYVTITRTSVAINQESNYRLDLDAFEAGIEAGQAAVTANERPPREAVAQLGAVVSNYDEFLAGFSLRGSQGFEEWVLTRRERLRLRVVEALHEVVDAYLCMGDYGAGILHARQLVALAPLREAAHRQLMQLLACDGRRNAALVQYDACRQQLADDLGVAPTAETIALFERIRDGRMRTKVQTAAGSDASKTPVEPAPCPYQGLDAFSEEDADLFFGREAIVERLLEAVRTQPLVALVGPSGSGKSSVLFAGLVPTLHRVSAESTGTERWCLASFRPGRRPFFNLATALRAHLEPERTGADDMIAARRLADALRSGRLAIDDVIQRVLHTQPIRSRPILIIDQFEELFTLSGDVETRDAFLELIASIVASATCTVVLALRADFMGQALASRSLADLLQDATLHLGPMTREELHRSIEEPARWRGVAFEDGLIGRILDDTSAAPGRLPLLEFSLTVLWGQQENARLTHAAYDAIGGVDDALTRYANRVYDGLSPADQALARDVLVQLIHPGEGTEDTRRVATRKELGDEKWALARRLADVRLVVTNRDPSQNETVEIVHEALIQNWRRLQRWMEDDRTFRVWQERLRVALRQWEESERNARALLRGIALSDAERWHDERDGDLSRRERDFIRASLAARDERRQEEAERQARERELEQRSRNRLRLLAIVLAVAALATMVLLALAVGQWNAARASAAESQSLALASGAQLALLEDRTDRALSLAVAANQSESPPAQARFMLSRAAYARGTIRRFTGHSGAVRAAVLSTSGEKALSASDDHALILWDVDSGDVVRRFTGHSSAVTDLSWHEESGTILSGALDSALIVWNLETGAVRRRLTGYDSAVHSVALGPTGQTALSGHADGTIIVWEVATGTVRRRLTGHTDAVYSVAISPDGRLALSGSADRSMLLWDLDSGEMLRRFDGHTDWVRAVAFTPDGTRAVSGSEDTDIILWDLESGEQVRRFPQETAGILSLDVGVDGRTMLAGSLDSTIVQWDLQTGDKIGQFLGHSGRVFDVAIARDGTTALSAGEDGFLRLWTLRNGAEVRRLRYETGAPSVAISPDGRRALTGLANGDISLWDMETGRELRRLTGHEDRVFAGVAFSPDGEWAASGSGDIFEVSDDNTLRIWDLSTGRELQRMTGHTDQLWDIDISPGGKRMLSSSRDGTVRLWDVASGRELRRFENDVIPNGVAFGPEGHTALVGTGRALPGSDAEADYSVRWLDLETGQQGHRFEGHRGIVMSVEVSPDGRRALSAGLDGLIILWDLETRQEIRRLEGHSAGVVDVAFSPDGRLALSGSVDNTVMLWDLEQGTLLRHYTGHGDIVTDVAFGPDGRTALSAGSRDGTVRTWRIDPSPPALLSWIEGNRFTPELSCEQRALYRVEPLC